MLERDTVSRLLKRTELCSGVDDAQIEELIARSTQRTFEHPAYVFEQGDPSDIVYIVLTGEVWIVSVSLEGNSLVHRAVHPGEMFGEVAALDQGVRTSGAMAAQTCELLVIPGGEFIRFLERNASAALHLARRLASRIRSTSQLLEDAVFLPARHRVARKLVELAQSQGKRQPRGHVALENVTHETLASMVGLHRVTVTNQITQLERDGLVRSERKRLLVLDLPGLESLAEGSSHGRR